jgi:uncharacterized protein YceK
MKKIVSLILGMFLILLSGCGKSSKLIRPTDSAETQENTELQQKVVETSEDIPDSDIHTSEPSQDERSYVWPEADEG